MRHRLSTRLWHWINAIALVVLFMSGLNISNAHRRLYWGHAGFSPDEAWFERAREGKVKPEDLRGATFTVSNMGPYNVDHFSAIISPPESGIIAVGSAKKVPVVLDDGTKNFPVPGKRE